MEGQKKQFILITVLIVVCIGGYFGLKAYNERQAEKEEEASEKETFTAVSVDAAAVNSFSYQVNGVDITFEKEEGMK